MADRETLLAYACLVAGAVLPIYHGSYLSLRTPRTTRELLKKERDARRKARRDGGDASDSDDSDDDEDDDAPITETLTSSDAWWFPVLGSAVLLSMYLVFKFLDRRYVDLLLGVYFGAVGVAAVSKTFSNVADGILGRERVRRMQKFSLAITRLPRKDEGRADKGKKSEKADKEDHILLLRFARHHVALSLVGVGVVGAYLAAKPWYLTNVIALALAYNGIALMGLDSFATGAIMLGGLFLYDIFWVFGTEVMVSVARGFDGPIKIVCPKNLVQGVGDIVAALVRAGPAEAVRVVQATKWQHTMLGLGDIVIPGIFIALALRFDQHQHSVRHPSTSLTRHSRNFPKPYFHATLVAYLAGLVTTMAVMTYFKAAQPALLYLSPACTGAVALTALRRREWSAISAWSDAEEEEDESKAKKSEGAGEGQDETEVQPPAAGTRQATAAARRRQSAKA